MEMISSVLSAQKESTVHPLMPNQRSTVMMEHIHGVPRSDVLLAPVDGCAQIKMGLAMSNVYLYVIINDKYFC